MARKIVELETNYTQLIQDAQMLREALKKYSYEESHGFAAREALAVWESRKEKG